MWNVSLIIWGIKMLTWAIRNSNRNRYEMTSGQIEDIAESFGSRYLL